MVVGSDAKEMNERVRACLEESEEEREKAERVIWCGGCKKDWTCVIYLVVYWLYLMYCTGSKFFPINNIIL